MTSKEIKKLIANRRILSTRFYDQKAYKIGVNSGIFQSYPKPDPDNRIPIPFVRRAILLAKGYFASPGNITYSDKTGWWDTYIKPVYFNNNEELETASLFEDCLAYGSAFELHWADEQGRPQFDIIPVAQAIPVYTETLRPELEQFLWMRKTGDGKTLVTFWDKSIRQEWEQEKEKDDFVLISEKQHFYTQVPIIEATIDRDKCNMFDHVLPLMDAYDKLTSEVANEHEKFANSILLLKNTIDSVTKDSSGLTEADKVKLWRMLDDLGEDVHKSAGYLERNVNHSFYDSTFDRWERLIYETLCIFNPNDHDFSTASGIAQAYKLLGFELLIANYESYFQLALQKRLKLIAGNKLFSIPFEGADGVTINTRRNLPFDIESMAKISALLKGSISEESRLKLFPSTIIDDIPAEIEALKKMDALYEV